MRGYPAVIDDSELFALTLTTAGFALDTAHVVPDREVLDVVVERVRGEVAPPDVFLDAAVEVVAEYPAVLVVRSTKVQAEQLLAAPGLALVIRAGAGVDNIHMETANARGIYVAN